MKHRQKTLLSAGFTLVEVLVVIVVIGILASVSVVAYNGFSDRAYASKVTSTVNSYAKILRLYHIQNGRFPDGSTQMGTCLGRPSDYPAADGFPTGACVSGNPFTYYARNTMNDDIFASGLVASLPDPTIRIAQETFSVTSINKYRGIYYEFFNNYPPGDSRQDVAYVEYVVHGNVDCAKDPGGGSTTRRYSTTDNSTFCGMRILANDSGSD